MATATKNATTVAPVMLVAKLDRINVYENMDGIRYRFVFNKTFAAYRRNDDGTNVLAEANYIDFMPSVAIAQLINCMPELADIHVDAREKALRNGVSGGLSAAQLQILCRGAEFTIQRSQFAAGDPYTTFDGQAAVHEHDGISSNIVSVKLNERQAKMLEEMQMRLLISQL